MNKVEGRSLLTVKSVLQGCSYDWYENILKMQQNLGGTLQSKDESTNSLQDTKSSDALVICENSIFIISTLFNDVSDNSQVGITLCPVSIWSIYNLGKLTSCSVNSTANGVNSEAKTSTNSSITLAS